MEFDLRIFSYYITIINNNVTKGNLDKYILRKGMLYFYADLVPENN